MLWAVFFRGFDILMWRFGGRIYNCFSDDIGTIGDNAPMVV